jgi:CHAD domain-containing protein
MPEAGRKIITRFVAEMLTQEPIARLGEDPEGVHKMRVATRRIRSLYRLLRPYLPPAYRAGLPAHFRHTARVLGEVRDLDVFGERTQVYIEKHLQGEPGGLVWLTKIHHNQHFTARRRLEAWLDSPAYTTFIDRLVSLLAEPTTLQHLWHRDKTPFRYEVAQTLPVLIYTRYEEVRRYESLFTHADAPTLHQFRIEVKRLRYALDAFQAVLGEKVKFVIQELKTLQESLGDLNDASVADLRLATLQKAMPPKAQPSLEAYRHYNQQVVRDLSQALPEAWAHFNRPETRQALAMALAEL